MSEETRKEPSLIEALIPVLMLIVMLWASVRLFGDGSSSGPNQMALLLAAAAAVIVGMRNGYTWEELQDAMISGVFAVDGSRLYPLHSGLVDRDVDHGRYRSRDDLLRPPDPASLHLFTLRPCLSARSCRSPQAVHGPRPGRWASP